MELRFILNLVYVQTPVHTIASNAGVEGAVVVGKLLEQDNPDLGYDAAKGQYCTSPLPSLSQQFVAVLNPHCTNLFVLLAFLLEQVNMSIWLKLEL